MSEVNITADEDSCGKKRPWKKAHFEQLDNKRFKCLQCKETYGANTGHTVLKKHVASAHAKDQPSISRVLKPPQDIKFEDVLETFIVKSHLPFSLVESEAMKTLISHLKPDKTVTLPTRKTFVRRLKEKLDLKRAELKSRLREVSNWISLTTDIWTSRNNIPFAAVTAHFVGQTRRLEAILIDFVEMPFPHSGYAIARMLEDVCERYQIQERVRFITTDNASNNLAAMKQLTASRRLTNLNGTSHVRCLSHVLNLIVHKAIEDKNPDIGRLREVMSFLRHPKQAQLLLETAETLNQTAIKPLLDVPTRWNSTYDMIDRGLKLKTCMRHLLDTHKDYQHLDLSETSWVNLELMSKFLEAFYEATKLMSGSSYTTLSYVIPVMQSLRRHCEQALNEPSLQPMASKALSKMSDYQEVLYTSTAQMAAWLDPRFKDTTAVNGLKDVSELARVESDRRRPGDLIIRQPCTQNFKASLFKQYVSERSEIDRYSAMEPAFPDDDPIAWWSAHSSHFPVLSSMAFDMLSIPATSVMSEHCFSNAGDIVNQKRCRLEPNNIELAVLLNSWL
ncbi:putative AC transposase [Halotydeus destructor]|nr:putative AC transposase [Halotydeus destructor]